MWVRHEHSSLLSDGGCPRRTASIRQKREQLSSQRQKPVETTSSTAVRAAGSTLPGGSPRTMGSGGARRGDCGLPAQPTETAGPARLSRASAPTRLCRRLRRGAGRRPRPRSPQRRTRRAAFPDVFAYLWLGRVRRSLGSLEGEGRSERAQPRDRQEKELQTLPTRDFASAAEAVRSGARSRLETSEPCGWFVAVADRPEGSPVPAEESRP